MEHAPVLLLLAPLAASILIAVLAMRRTGVAYAVATTATAAAAALSWALLLRVVEHGPVTYLVAGWGETGAHPPGLDLNIGIELVVDVMGGFVAAVVATMAAMSMVWSRHSVLEELGDRGPTFYAVACLALTGLLGMCVTGDAFNLFVFLEVASLAGYALVGSGGGRSQLAAFRYLILGATGASLYLLGVGYLYAATGTLNMGDLAGLLTDHPLTPVALAFIISGLGLKMGLFPLHAWMPDAYTCSPSAVAAFIAPVFTKVMALALMRFLFTIFGVEAFEGALPAGQIIAWMGAIAAIVGAGVAAVQSDLRRLLAWSSVGQIGYIGVGIGIGSPLAIAAALLHVMNHSLMKGALFYVAGSSRARRISELRGLSRRMPVTAVCLVIAAASLVGVPPLGGFFSKWYLLQAAIGASQPWLAAAVIGGSLLAIAYVFRILEAALLAPEKAPATATTSSGGAVSAPLPRTESPPSSLAPLVVVSGLIIVTGLLSHLIVTRWLLGAAG
ncbi:MAG: complex I subunit 5 family protein [Myxococcota bacterium]